MTNNIVVLGAGVSGLTTAYLLSQDPANKITVLAKHMPGDYDIEYASPWAGANYMPVGKEGSDHQKWERNTWPALKEITEKYPEAGIHFRGTLIYNRKKDQESDTGKWFSELVQPNPWYKDVVPDFKPVAADKLAPGIDNGQEFTSVCINTAVYLPWLVGQCVKNGAVFERAVCKHITDAANAHHTGQKADVVINCTGLSAKTLGGVLDDTMYPARGQIVVVRNDPGPMMSQSGTDDGEDEALYIMTRAAGGGTILGGSYQKHNWDPLPDMNLANRIMKRCIEISPSLVKKGQGIEGLDIIRHGVGLRPLRKDGTRIEKDNVDGVAVVHNYGHGGFGYQASFGCAYDAVALVKEVPSTRHGTCEPPELNASPEIVLAMLIDALIKARPISHELTQKTMKTLIEAGYHDINVLSNSSWEDRTMVLSEGGYNRYREQCATNLGELGKLVVQEYDGDLNNLLKQANGKREKARILLKEVKGIGDLAVEVFFNNVQSVWPSIAPSVDSRSLKTAAEMGMGTDLDQIYEVLGEDPVRMSWFANGLAEVRLEKRQEVIEEV
ncbi:FAD dependent oxidoreductase [Penicillium paradoxum]|uniref:FAD dependent oxidoreductase n=1 Tax=Penicillium paradoxum TaxID=176176 RepID=UPI002547CD1A|nr:FAD dependent oxidoreductase [Penicillium paradoxum]KAJ5782849.1 FAD dependent oxidoreductase [Penicillium paradoxum]